MFGADVVPDQLLVGVTEGTTVGGASV